MAKAKRGRNIKTTLGWRGTCPACSRTGVKLLWEKSQGEGKVKCCKNCSN